VERHTIEKAVHDVRRMSFREHRQKELLRKAQVLLNDKRAFSVKRRLQLNLALHHYIEAFIRFIKAQTGMTPKEIRKKASHALDSESWH